MSEQNEVVIVGQDGTEHVFPPGFDPKRAAQIVRNAGLQAANAKPLKEPTSYDEGFDKSVRQTGRDTLHGATATLPVIGATLGGIAGSGAAPIVGTAAGAGGGAALGEGLRRIINAGVGGDARDMADMPAQMGVAGASAGITQGALSTLPMVAAALKPSAIADDLMASGISKRPILKEMGKRFVTAARSGPQPMLKRPAWQASEQPPPEPMPDAYDRFMPNTPADAEPMSAEPSAASTQPAQTPTPPSSMTLDAEAQAELQRLLLNGVPLKDAAEQVSLAQHLKQVLGTSEVPAKTASDRWPSAKQ